MEPNSNCTFIDDVDTTETIEILSGSEILNVDLDLLDNDTALTLWNSCLTPEHLNAFNFCYQNGFDISDNLYLAYKDFHINQNAISNVSFDLSLIEAAETIPLSIETDIHSVSIPNTTVDCSSPISIKTSSLKSTIDNDHDVLSYPNFVVDKTKNNRNTKQKYFVLTSPEAMRAKLNDLKKKEEKVEAAKLKKLKQLEAKEKRLRLQQDREIKKQSKHIDFVINK